MHLKVDLSILGFVLGCLVLDWSCQFWVDRCQTTIAEVSGLSNSVFILACRTVVDPPFCHPSTCPIKYLPGTLQQFLGSLLLLV